MTDQLITVVAGLFGALFGSFLNVCIVRLPKNESVVHPRSRCPKCAHQIAWYDNVPVLSWLVLRGRCRGCREPIPVFYPLIELSVAAIWAGAAWYYGPTVDGASAAIFGTLLLGIAATDAREYIIPDEFTLGGLVVGLLLSLAGGWHGLLQAAIGAATGFSLLWFVGWAGTRLLGQEAMGGGDIKMMAMVGAFTGWVGVLMTIFGGALVGTVIFGPIHLIARARRGEAPLVPFGIFLAVAAALTFHAGDLFLDWYLALIRP